MRSPFCVFRQDNQLFSRQDQANQNHPVELAAISSQVRQVVLTRYSCNVPDFCKMHCLVSMFSTLLYQNNLSLVLANLTTSSGQYIPKRGLCSSAEREACRRIPNVQSMLGWAVFMFGYAIRFYLRLLQVHNLVSLYQD